MKAKTNTNTKYGVFGVGHLGHAICAALHGAAGVPIADVYIGVRPEKANPQNGVFGSMPELAGAADVVFMTVRPAVFREMAQELAKADYSGKTVVSCMAGVSSAECCAALPGAELVLAMPTTSVEDGCGVIAYTKCSAGLAQVFAKFGIAVETTEDELPKYTAFSGCGLGFAARMISAYISAGVSLGLTEKDCRDIAEALFTAAAKGDPKATVTAVVTPGGVTERGIIAMETEKSNIDGLAEMAVTAAYDKVRGRK
ncbi:MAG: NAD(P)-binding domain-containing protein [Oscillospiraceae bacterium]|nr:NAD(P)-binding domain-containing protein [Oscillospiraceae bacterium]